MTNNQETRYKQYTMTKILIIKTLEYWLLKIEICLIVVTCNLKFPPKAVWGCLVSTNCTFKIRKPDMIITRQSFYQSYKCKLHNKSKECDRASFQHQLRLRSGLSLTYA